MMNDRLTVQRDQRDGGWYVVVDGATKRFDTKPEAVSVVCTELGAFEEVSAMNADALENIKELKVAKDKLRAALDSASVEFERLRGELEQEKAEKNKWILEAYNWKETVTKLGKHIARTCV